MLVVIFLFFISSQRSALLLGRTGRAGQHAAGSAGGAGERNQSEAPEGRTQEELRPTLTGRWTEPMTSEEGGFYRTLTLYYTGRSVIRPVRMRLWTLEINAFSKSLRVPSRNYKIIAWTIITWLSWPIPIKDLLFFLCTAECRSGSDVASRDGLLDILYLSEDLMVKLEDLKVFVVRSLLLCAQL